ncbi:hypothetical protein [Halomonas lysinitropha]|uniref:Uncharacterized protein n=1 Tax=Halomonas lysinitropha TaxID=2607506 RepID=A0A5K1IBZ4_9GAMM|nr:hypothetical protein [Halomonas lysinitropha]VVZ96469.1 hypothetical protein HALO32_02569 [Halomonas lysinitropha]
MSLYLEPRRFAMALLVSAWRVYCQSHHGAALPGTVIEAVPCEGCSGWWPAFRNPWGVLVILTGEKPAATPEAAREQLRSRLEAAHQAGAIRLPGVMEGAA